MFVEFVLQKVRFCSQLFQLMLARLMAIASKHLWRWKYNIFVRKQGQIQPKFNIKHRLKLNLIAIAITVKFFRTTLLASNVYRSDKIWRQMTARKHVKTSFCYLFVFCPTWCMEVFGGSYGLSYNTDSNLVSFERVLDGKRGSVQ